jgi:hypothetical protein
MFQFELVAQNNAILEDSNVEDSNEEKYMSPQLLQKECVGIVTEENAVLRKPMKQQHWCSKWDGI